VIYTQILCYIIYLSINILCVRACVCAYIYTYIHIYIYIYIYLLSRCKHNVTNVNTKSW